MSATASAGSNPAGEADVLEAGGLLRPAAELPRFSRSDTCTPASPSNSSRYAWPDRLGSGLVNANSAFTSSSDGAVDRLGGELVQEAGDARWA